MTSRTQKTSIKADDQAVQLLIQRTKDHDVIWDKNHSYQEDMTFHATYHKLHLTLHGPTNAAGLNMTLSHPNPDLIHTGPQTAELHEAALTQLRDRREILTRIADSLNTPDLEEQDLQLHDIATRLLYQLDQLANQGTGPEWTMEETWGHNLWTAYHDDAVLTISEIHNIPQYFALKVNGRTVIQTGHIPTGEPNQPELLEKLIISILFLHAPKQAYPDIDPPFDTPEATRQFNEYLTELLQPEN